MLPQCGHFLKISIISWRPTATCFAFSFEYFPGYEHSSWIPQAHGVSEPSHNASCGSDAESAPDDDESSGCVDSIVTNDPCTTSCVDSKRDKLLQFVQATATMSKTERKASLLATLSVLASTEDKTSTRVSTQRYVMLPTYFTWQRLHHELTLFAQEECDQQRELGEHALVPLQRKRSRAKDRAATQTSNEHQDTTATTTR
ncbi:hypothetical protein PybrP1_007870, partial [[Pythium] brassicae (nom. inval.)]